MELTSFVFPAIGTGLFLGTGGALASAGPAGILIAYSIMGAAFWGRTFRTPVLNSPYRHRCLLHDDRSWRGEMRYLLA